MKLEEVNQVKQTGDETTVNNYLDKGYEILRIFNCKVKTEASETAMPMYVLGLKRGDSK